MILVTGATGTIGSNVVRLLTERDVPFRAMSRTPAADLPNKVQADFTDPASLASAVTGIDTIFLVTAPPVPSPIHDLALLKAARAANVAKIVKLSAIGTGEHFEDAVVGAWHLAAEQAIEDSGLAWTVLRPTSFASNFLQYRDLINTGDPIPNMLGSAEQAVVDPRDVAEVAVEALVNEAHNGQRYDLTGPELLTFEDQATIMGKILNHQVKTLTVDARTHLQAAGMPPESTEAVAIGTGWARAGGAAYVTDQVSSILNRPARTFEQWATDHQTHYNVMR